MPDQPRTPGAEVKPRSFASLARQVILPWTTGIRPTWTLAQIRAALFALRTGDFGPPAQLFDSMLEDDEIPGDIQKRINATLRSEFHLKIDEDRKLNRKEQSAADLWCEIVPDDQLFDLVASWLILGVGVGTLDWQVDGPIWRPRLRALPTEFLRWDETERCWYYESTTGRQRVTPGDGKWVLLANGDRPWNWGLIRALAVLWLSKQLTYGDWQRYCQKHGLPIIKAKTPIFADAREKEAFVDDLAQVQSEGVIGLPQGQDGLGYDVELLEATDGSWESFQANLERCDRKIQVQLLGSNVGTELVEDGSKAAAETSAKGIDQEKAKSDAKRIGAVLKDQVLRPFFALNYGDSVDVPFPYWDVCPEDDARDWADAQTAFVGMLNAIRTSGYRLANAEELAREYGLELEVDEAAPPAPGTEAAAEIAAKAKPPVAKPPSKKGSARK